MTIREVRAACPHDCPDTCAMRVTVENARAIKPRRRLDRTICSSAGGEAVVATYGAKVGMHVEHFAEGRLVVLGRAPTFYDCRVEVEAAPVAA